MCYNIIEKGYKCVIICSSDLENNTREKEDMENIAWSSSFMFLHWNIWFYSLDFETLDTLYGISLVSMCLYHAGAHVYLMSSLPWNLLKGFIYILFIFATAADFGMAASLASLSSLAAVSPCSCITEHISSLFEDRLHVNYCYLLAYKLIKIKTVWIQIVSNSIGSALNE
ncbi:hypothetical protein ACJX0J_024224, partial [Zea mays]